jgi:MFS family permease
MRQAVIALRFRDYRLFWSGALVSNTGTWMQNVTVPYVLYELTHSGVWVGMTIVAQVLPSILLNPLAGSLADRFSRRDLLRVSNAIQGLAALGLWLLWVSGVRSPSAILVFVALNGTAAMVVAPAWQAFVADLVPDEHLLNAVTLNSAQANGARALGPAFGGVVLGTLGPAWAFGLNALSFVAVLVNLTLLRPPRRPAPALEGGVFAQYREAAAFARRSTSLRTAYALTAIVCGLGYPIFQLASIFASRVYHAGPGRYGALTASYGVGAIIGAVLLGTLGHGRRRSHILPVVAAVQGAGLLLFGLNRSFWIGLPLLAIVGAGSLCAIATLNTVVQSASPDALRGRVLALWVLSYTASYPVGSLVEGWLSDGIGPGPTVALAGALSCASVAALVARPALMRSLDVNERVAVIDPVPATG